MIAFLIFAVVVIVCAAIIAYVIDQIEIIPPGARVPLKSLVWLLALVAIVARAAPFLGVA